MTPRIRKPDEAQHCINCKYSYPVHERYKAMWNVDMVCRREPVTVDKIFNDWCGEYKEYKLPKKHQ